MEQIYVFSPLFFEILYALGVIILIHDSCCTLKTTIQAEKHQQLKFVILLSRFLIQEYVGLNGINIFPD